MLRWIKLLALIVVLALLGRWGWQRFFVSDETRIRRQITLMEEAVEQGNLIKLDGAIATDYRDDNGLDKSGLLAAVRVFRAQYGTVFIHISDLTVTVAADHRQGEALFIAKVLATPVGSVTATEVRQERFRIFLRQTDRVWRLYRAESPELKFD